MYATFQSLPLLSVSSRIIEVQEKCTERALELLALPSDSSAMLLDLGCGSGLSGEAITENGHFWVGMDISSSMLGEFLSLTHVLWSFSHYASPFC